MSAGIDPAEMAWQVAETIRALNHATLPARSAPPCPAQLCAVVAALATAADRLPQLLTQLGDQLAGQAQGLRLDADATCTTAADAVTATGSALDDAARQACAAGAALHDAQQVLAHLGIIPYETDCEETILT